MDGFLLNWTSSSTANKDNQYALDISQCLLLDNVVNLLESIYRMVAGGCTTDKPGRISMTLKPSYTNSTK